MTENIHAFAARFIAQISDRLYDPNPQIDGYDRAEMVDALTGELAAGISAWLRDTLPYVDELPPIEAWLVSVSAPDSPPASPPAAPLADLVRQIVRDELDRRGIMVSGIAGSTDH